MADWNGKVLKSMQEKAIENQSDNFYKATADYFCRIEGCKKYGKKIPKGFSHSHPTIGDRLRKK